MRSSCTVGTGAGSINSAQDALQQNNGGHCAGTLYVVGIGPGSIEDMSGRAQRALEQSDYIVGYDTYLKLIQPLLAGKEIVGTGMMQEIERCRRAVELAGEGKTVAVVSSGDPGIYGMAGLVLELAQQAPSERGWMQRAKTLCEKIEHHLEEEESRFFQQSGKILGEAQKTSLAKSYRRDYQRLLKSPPYA